MTTTPAPVETRPIEVTTPILPSEAMRLGRLTRPNHIACKMFDGDTAACAVGAMAIGWGYDGPTDGDHDGYVFVPPLLDMFGLNVGGLSHIYDLAVDDDRPDSGPRGDAAVLAYLESRGL